MTLLTERHAPDPATVPRPAPTRRPSPPASALARSARARGFVPLGMPRNYYDDIAARFDLEDAAVAELRELHLGYDRDATGEYLHFYTRTVGEVFLEFVERIDAYAGYGAGTAPVRLTAQGRR